MLGKTNRLFGAILLIAGTTIGAGMLALPVTVGLAGFLPSCLLMLAIWLFMMLTAFYLLEVNLRIKQESNLISMTRATLGKAGEGVAWVVYLLLLYALTAAYLLGCSQILARWFPLFFTAHLGPILVLIFFSLCIYVGMEMADLLNRLLMGGLILAYIILVGSGITHIDPTHLTYTDWPLLLPAISIVLTTFGYHIIIPTLTTYLERDVLLLKRAICIGSLLPFVIYFLWQCLVIGVVPIEGLQGAAKEGLQATFVLQSLLANPWIGVAAQCFAFFAIVTSLLGVSLSLSDFLADGLKIKKNRKGKFLLIFLTFFPPLIFTLFYPQGFILALKYAGIFVVLLLALLPALMTWASRYREKSHSALLPATFMVPGGKWIVGGTIVCALTLLILEMGL